MANCESESVDVNDGSESVFDLFCQPCTEENRHLKAEGYCMDCVEYLCKDCFDNHRKPRPTRHHALVHNGQMPQRADALQTKAKTLKDPCSIACDKHLNEIIKFYCEKHNAVLCSVCVTLLHATCNLEYIPDISKGSKDGNALKRVCSNINDLAGKIAFIDKMSMNNLKCIQDIYDETMEAIKTLRRDINEMIDKMEERIKEQADSLRAADMENIESITQTCANIKLELISFREHLDRLQKSDQENNLFVQINIINNKLNELQMKLKGLDENNTVINYTFERTDDVWDFVNNIDAYGQLRQICRDRKSLEKLTAKHLKDVPLKLEEDKENPTITGSVILPGKLIVLIDYFNQKLKVFDFDSCKIKSTYRLDGSPWNITKTGRQTVALPLSDKNTLVCLHIDQQVEIEKEIRTSGQCIGVEFSKARYFVVLFNPSRLEILNQDGKILQNIMYYDNGECLFDHPQYISTNDDDIFVSDSRTNKVTIFSNDGKFKAEYTSADLDSSLDIVAYHRGAIFVCGCSSNNIHVVSEQGCFKQMLLSSKDGIKGPQSITFSEKTSLLFVTQEYDQRLRIYQIS